MPVASLESGIPSVPIFDKESQLDAAKEASIFVTKFSNALAASDDTWNRFSPNPILIVQRRRRVAAEEWENIVAGVAVRSWDRLIEKP